MRRRRRRGVGSGGAGPLPVRAIRLFGAFGMVAHAGEHPAMSLADDEPFRGEAIEHQPDRLAIQPAAPRQLGFGRKRLGAAGVRLLGDRPQQFTPQPLSALREQRARDAGHAVPSAP